MTQIYQDIENTHKNEVNCSKMGSVVIGSSEGDLTFGVNAEESEAEQRLTKIQESI